MRKAVHTAAGAIALAILGTVLTPAVALAGSMPYVVVLKGTVHNADAETKLLGNHDHFTPGFRYSSALKGFAAHLTARQRSELKTDPAVAYVTPDVTISAAGLVPLIAGETLPVGIRRIGAASTTAVHAASGVGVAVLDTGIDLSNPDLNAVSGVNCIRSGAPAQDDNGHGTNVAGIIAARDQGATVVGVAPGTRLYSVKVLGADATGKLSQILCGINWVTANAGALNIKVANMSLVGGGKNDNNCGKSNNDAEHAAICTSTAAGVTYVAAAGNNSGNFSGYVPAAYPEVLTATAMTDTDGLPGGLGRSPCVSGERDDRYGSYSSYAVASADQAHTIAAPGTCVVADNLGGGTSAYLGTSQAAPHVAGAVALCLDDGSVPGPCSGLTPARVIARVRADAAAAATAANGFTGDPLHPITGRYYGYLVSAAGY